MLAEDDELVKSIMEENVISVTTLADQEQVAQMFSNYNFLALPVVDNENRLVGIVTIDDVAAYTHAFGNLYKCDYLII